MAKLEKDEGFYGVEVGGLIYYFGAYDIEALKGLILFKKAFEDNKGKTECSL